MNISPDVDSFSVEVRMLHAEDNVDHLSIFERHEAEPIKRRCTLCYSEFAKTTSNLVL